MLECFPEGGTIEDNSVNPSGLGPVTIGPFALPAHLNSTSFRLDHTLSSKLAMFVRYGDAPSYSQTRQLYSVSTNHLGSRTFSFGANSQLFPNLNNEFRWGLAHNSSSLQTRTKAFYFYQGFLLDLNSAMGIPTSYSSVNSEAYIQIVGVGDSESSTDQASGSLNQWNLRDTFNLQAGKHLFKFLVDERRIVSNIHPPALSQEPGPWTGAPCSLQRTWAEKDGAALRTLLQNMRCWTPALVRNME